MSSSTENATSMPSTETVRQPTVLSPATPLPVSPVPEIWYRYDDVRYAAPLDEYDEPMGVGRLDVVLSKFVVVRRTAKGVWLYLFWGDKPPKYIRDGHMYTNKGMDEIVDTSRDKITAAHVISVHTYCRFVRDDSRKRYACRTLEEAHISFIARKQKQASIYQNRAEQALEAIRLLQHKSEKIKTIATMYGMGDAKQRQL